MPRLPSITPIATTLDDLDLIYVERLQSGSDTSNPANNSYKTAPIFKRDAAAAFKTTARAGADKTANYPATQADCGRVITVNASGASGGLTVIVGLALGTTAKIWNCHVERSYADTTDNPIFVFDDSGNLVGQILNPNNGRVVYRIAVQTDGVNVTSPVQA